MQIFQRRKDKQAAKQALLDKRTAEDKKKISELKRFRDIGETFQYLDATMIVRRHLIFDGPIPTTWSAYSMRRIQLPSIVPGLECQYVDKIGVLRDITFKYESLPMLRRMQKES